MCEIIKNGNFLQNDEVPIRLNDSTVRLFLSYIIERSINETLVLIHTKIDIRSTFFFLLAFVEFNYNHSLVS